MPVSRPGSSPIMFGRGRELAALRALLPRPGAGGPPPVALLSGEAGIGKSRLVRELAAVASPARLLVGNARQEDAGTPFGLLREALAPEVAAWSGMPGPLEAYRHPLAHLLTPLLAFRDHPDDGHEHRSGELAYAGLALIRHLVGDGPALLVFEDLHWADADSLMLLGRLVRAERLPALIVGTFRPEDYDRRQPLAALLDELERERRVAHLRLEPLARADLRRLLQTLAGVPVSDTVAGLLHERTRGNPFFVEELVAAVDAAGSAGPALDPAVVVDAPLPWTASEAVLRRLERLGAGSRELLDVAAVLGERFSYSLLAAVVGKDEDDLVDALRALVSAGVLAEHRPDEFGFRHALAREAVAGQLLGRQRRRIHRRALAVLQRDAAADPAAMAVHAHGGGDGAAAVRHARAAAAAALRDGAPRQAARTARLGLTHDSGDPGLLAIVARATAQVGDLSAAADHARRWADAAAGHGDRQEQAAAECLLAWLSWSSGRRREAWAALDAAEKAVATLGESAATARVRAVQAQLHMLSGHNAQAISLADRALALADEVGDRRVRAHALVTKGTALTDARADTELERVEEAVELLAAARVEAEAAGDVDTLTRALNNSIFPGQGLTSLAESRALIDEARALAERYGAERFAAKVATIDAYTCILEGDAERARRVLGDGTGAPASLDAFFWTSLEAYLEIETGDHDRGRAILDAILPQLERLEPGEGQMDCAVAEAALAAATGDAELAERALLRAGASVRQVATGSYAAWWDVAVCAIEAGVRPETVQALRDRQAPPAVRRHAGAVAHLSGLLLAAGGRAGEAVGQLRVAARAPLGQRPLAVVAAAHTTLGELLAGGGELAAARDHAAAAVGLLARWPGWRLERARGLQRRLGSGERPVHELLTARELEVCRLLVRGLSNGEIAAQLFISPKTASVHVSNILTKTGLRRRAQVAAWAVEAGLEHARPASRPLSRRSSR